MSKVNLSCWKRWLKPTRIKDPGLCPTLTFSTLSNQNESVPSSNTLCDTTWATGWKEQWGVMLSTSTLHLLRQGLFWFQLTHQLYMSEEEAPWWLLMIKAITTAHKKQKCFVFWKYVSTKPKVISFCIHQYHHWRTYSVILQGRGMTKTNINVQPKGATVIRLSPLQLVL